jgi:hypothetical protein
MVYAVKIVPKSKSRLMRIINGILWLSNKLGITNIRGFMTEYATTIHRTVYWPDDQAGMHMEPNDRMLHEFAHTLLWKYRGLRYDLGFIFVPRLRALFETICVQTNMLLDARKATQAYIVGRIEQFVNYGISKEIVRKELNARLTEINEKCPQLESQETAEAYKAWLAMKRG